MLLCLYHNFCRNYTVRHCQVKGKYINPMNNKGLRSLFLDGIDGIYKIILIFNAVPSRYKSNRYNWLHISLFEKLLKST
jgi:hypothetical protein